MIGEVRHSPHRASRDGLVPSWIVLHTTVGSFGSATHWFEDPASGVSAHHLVGLDGRVRSFVSEEDAASHAGRVHEPTSAMARRAAAAGESPNLTSIGIELVDDGNPFDVVRTDAQYATAARLVARASERWAIPIDVDHVVGHREVTADKGCPGNVDLERIRLEAIAWLDGGPAGRPMVVSLLPARNAEKLLPRWLDLAPAWCDVVVALDDGSTDGTRAILEASPIVRALLTEPVRPTAAGWDDGRNRARLLEAAAAFAPDWVVQVDADEWIEPDHAHALRVFLSTDAVPGLAYGLLHRRAWGDGVDARINWVYRVFAWAPGLHMPVRALHFHPVPLEIERSGWVRTTVVLEHGGAADDRLLEERAAKYREADPDQRYPVSFGGLDAEPTHVVPREPRRHDLPVLLSPDDVDELAGSAARDGERPLLVVLLPVRNGEADLAGWFQAAGTFADAVVALDDGSTDGTLEVLESQPLVRRLLRHPMRESAAGWDDAANRQELLDAAGEMAPRWVMFLDADERLDPDDAAAWRAFLGSPEADRDAAYGFLVHRMVGPDSYDRADLWVFRAFAWRPGQLLPGDRLHLVPVPVTIAPSRWRPTTVRIQHLASVTEEARRARLRKYREADPDETYQESYEHLLEAPGLPIAWAPRPADLPVVVGSGAFEDADLDSFDPDAPILSAIVIARDDAERIERVVRSVVTQATDETFETIVVVSGSPETAAIVRRRFPDVTLLELPNPVLPGAARNAGLAIARGDFVSFPGSHIELPQGSLAARIRAHERGYPMVTGSTINATRTPSGWAAYFLDHSGSLPGRPSEELVGPPAHCSYEREILLRIGGFPEDLRAGEDTSVNNELARLGYHALRDAEIRIVHANPCVDVRSLLRHHVARGRGLGRIILRATPTGEPPIGVDTIRRHGLGYLPRRIGGTRANVRAWGGPKLNVLYRRVAPLVWLGAVAAWMGLWFELASGAIRGRTDLR